MTIANFIKNVQNIMRQDAGVDGDAQRISQLVWMLFLKIFDSKEKEWELEEKYNSVIPEELRWRNWAEDEEGITGDKLLEFVNEKLFKQLKNIKVSEGMDKRSLIVKQVFEDSYNYMKSGTLMRQVINEINKIDFTEIKDRHSFNDIYEEILKDLQSAGNAGEYYTPRPITDFILEMLKPQLKEKFADFACGTGGFLISFLNALPKAGTVSGHELLQNSFYGIEKKPMPHLLCMTNLLLHEIDAPNIKRDNSLAINVREITEEKKFDIIAMNPPFGGVEEKGIQTNFPRELRTSETADLFMARIMYSLKQNGRAAVVLPDGFLFGDDNTKIAIKKRLLKDFNLHTIVRVPNGAFSPYTSISTNILFFEKSGTTEKIDFYEMPLPEGLKNGFTKTKPLRKKHFNLVKKWWDNRDTETENAYQITLEQIEKNNYNLDFKNPNKTTEKDERTLKELLLEMNYTSKEIENLVSVLKEELSGIIE
ncbi:SAM-dependent methyltransferase [Candidatus Woesearchaeota archaeon]|nr:MAG: SAM-dependent methyltransferase [Candidatus Woesearchaeota archaeon]